MVRLSTAWVSLFFGIPAFAGSPATSESPRVVGVFLDRSGSMNDGRKAASMRESAKLLVATLPDQQEVVIIDFNHAAHNSRFSLGTWAGRQAAMKHIDGLHIEGGTDYLAALQASRLPPGTPAVFLSDGEHNGDTSAVLAFMKVHRPGPLYTVGVEAPAAADKLLSQMAALSSGSHVRVESSEALVKVFLDLAKQLGHYRAYSPREETVHCKRVLGRLLAFGFDAVPVLTGNKGVFQHTSHLPGEQVVVAAFEFPVPKDASLKATQKRTQQGRLAAILRQDLVRAEMHVLTTGGLAPAGGTVKTVTKFFDDKGKPIDPRNRTDLTSEFQLEDSDGKTIVKVLAKPSTTDPALEATVPMPKVSGPVTIRNITTDSSQGPPFVAEEARTFLVQTPARMTVDPTRLVLQGAVGRLTARLKPVMHHDKALTATFSAEWEGVSQDLRLLEAKDNNGLLEVQLQAVKAGIHRGTLTVHGVAAVPVESVRVPVEVTVRQYSLGLNLPEQRTINVGSILANSGMRQLTTLEIPSLDDESRQYTVDVEDLTNGAVVIPCQSDQGRILPTKKKPALVGLSADVGNIPAGTYTAAVLIKPTTGTEARQWRTTVTLTVSEPLTVFPIDFGTVEVGKIAKRQVLLKNSGEALKDIHIGKVTVAAKGGDIVGTIADKADLDSRQEKSIPLILAISPTVESRGVHEGTVAFCRAGKQQLVASIRLNIVGKDEGPSGLLVAPANIRLKANPGEIVQFELRTKLTADTETATDELQIATSSLRDESGKTLSQEIAFKATQSKLSQTSPATSQGFVIAPDRRGTFTAIITIRSKHVGTVRVPFTLDVQ